MLDMFNRIKKSKTSPLDWNKMYVQTIKKKNGSMKKLNNYRGIFLVPIMSLIFEKLLKNRITPTLKQHMTSFQTGDVKVIYSFCVVQLTTADILVESYG